MQNPHDPSNGWQLIPGAQHNPYNKWPQTPPGAHLGSQGGVYDQWEPKKEWVYDPPSYSSGTSHPIQTSIWDWSGCIGYITWFCVVVVIVACAIYACAIYAYSIYTSYSEGAYNSVQNGITSTWDGNEFQYDYSNNPNYNYGFSEMILTIDSIKKGSFYGKVRWPSFGNTVTKAVGTIITNVSHTKDARWKYVAPCSSKGIYLQFTETKYIQGNSALLNVTYYAVVCNGTLRGVWFYPDKPHDGPGGEITLIWKSP